MQCNNITVYNVTMKSAIKKNIRKGEGRGKNNEK